MHVISYMRKFNKFLNKYAESLSLFSIFYAIILEKRECYCRSKTHAPELASPNTHFVTVLVTITE